MTGNGQRWGLLLFGLYGAQVVSVGGFIALAAAGRVPVAAAVVIGVVVGASFVVPELLGPLPLVAAGVAAVWAVVALAQLLG